MARNLVFGALAGLFLCANQVSAATTVFIDGHRLFHMIEKGGKDLSARAAALTYMMGVLDGDVTTRHYTKEPQLICIPKPEGEKVYSIVKNYLVDHPKQRLFGGGWIVMQAMFLKFPCPPK